MQAGKYNSPFTWQQMSKAKDTTYGQQKHSFTNVGTLWGSLSPTTSATTQNFGASESQLQATVKLTQFPSVVQGDRLLDVYGILWIIDSVKADMFNSNETICDVHKFDTLNTI